MDDLADLSIEELANIEVTSVTRSSRKLSESAAAITVITSEELRRSGVTTLADALRMVPGMQVAQISSSTWAVSTRGFNSRYANKLLVQMDGRTLYSPLFSGVFWEVQDTLFEDIDRIEVIRGPGASLWGANAVNGIINIITKDASETKGTYASQAFGSQDEIVSQARWGGSIGNGGNLRIFAKGVKRDESVDANDKGINDPWELATAGFRNDVDLTDTTRNTLIGGGYVGTTDQSIKLPSLTPPYEIPMENKNDNTGFHLLNRTEHTLSGGSDVTLQLYFDRSTKEEGGLSWDGDIVDVDFQHALNPLEKLKLIWGGGYRYYSDTITSTSAFNFTEPSVTDHLASLFVHTETILTPTVELTLGTKLEHNDYTQFEVQPNARLLWMPHKSHTVWASVARAVRTPNRGDTQLNLRFSVIPPAVSPNPHSTLPLEIILRGQEDLDSETLVAMEMGYRYTPDATFSVDTTLFYYLYKDLYSYITTQAQGTAPPRLVTYNTLSNIMDGTTYGAELSVNVNPLPYLRVQAAYSAFQADFDIENGVTSFRSINTDGASPKHQISIRTGISFFEGLTADFWYRYMDAILDDRVPSYSELDISLEWALRNGLKLFCSGRNLLHDSHPEYLDSLLSSTAAEVERSFLAGASIKF